MNFFAAKEKAKKNTFWLTMLFALGVIATIILVNIIFIVFFAYIKQEDSSLFLLHFSMDDFLKISFFVLLIITISTFHKMSVLRGGGRVVAESLGGKLLHKNSDDLDKLKVLNVVEEMAIASGSLSIPVYLLPDDSINAFAAGYSMEDAVIGITKGAIKKLNRQELQGVIAHEFSHIFNGDMKLNIKTTALLNGVLVFGLMGQKLLGLLIQTSGNTTTHIINHLRGKKDEGNSLKLGLFGLGIALFIVGFVGTFVGNIIKSLISKQREYLADASAVGYTRDTSGIAGALKKIGGDSSAIASPSAATYSHFYFASGVDSLLNVALQTHPPLNERIYRIEPDWDGKFIKPKTSASPEQEEQLKAQNNKNKQLDKLYKILGSASVISALNDSGNVTEEKFDKAQETIQDIPQRLYAMTQDCFSAQALILGLLASYYDEVKKEQLDALMTKDQRLFNQMKKTFDPLFDLDKDRYLILLQLSLPSLKEMSQNQYKTYRALLLEWIYANKKVSFFEWILKYIIIHPLDIYFELESSKKIVFSKVEKLTNEIAFFGSFLATLNTNNVHEAKEKYDKAIVCVDIKGVNFINIYELNFTLLDEIFEKILLADYSIKKRLLELAINCLSTNKKVSPKHQEMLQAIALSFKVPLNLHG